MPRLSCDNPSHVCIHCSFPQPDNYLKLLKYLQKLDWGELTIEMKGGVPVMLRYRKDIKLDGNLNGL